MTVSKFIESVQDGYEIYDLTYNRAKSLVTKFKKQGWWLVGKERRAPYGDYRDVIHSWQLERDGKVLDISWVSDHEPGLGGKTLITTILTVDSYDKV